MPNIQIGLEPHQELALIAISQKLKSGVHPVDQYGQDFGCEDAIVMQGLKELILELQREVFIKNNVIAQLLKGGNS
jgi:hypothetical protein